MAPPFRLRLASWGWRTLQRNAQLRPSQMRSPAATGTRKRGKRGQPTFDAHRRMALVAGATPPRAAAPDARQRTSERSILINPPQRERARGPARGDGATLWRSHVGRVTRIWRNGEVGSFSRGRWDAVGSPLADPRMLVRYGFSTTATRRSDGWRTGLRSDPMQDCNHAGLPSLGAQEEPRCACRLFGRHDHTSRQCPASTRRGTRQATRARAQEPSDTDRFERGFEPVPASCRVAPREEGGKDEALIRRRLGPPTPGHL